MNPTNNLGEVLAELRQEYRSVEAPTFLEARLVEQVQLSPRLSPRNRIWAWGFSFAAMAACVAGITHWRLDRTLPLPKQSPQSASSNASAPSPASEEPSLSSAPTQASSVRTTPPRHTQAKPAKKNPPDNAADAFLVLPSSEGLPASSAASLVRLRIQKASLRQYGLDVPATATSETILAEFVVGEDGLPRAIRLIP